MWAPEVAPRFLNFLAEKAGAIYSLLEIILPISPG